MFLVLEDDSTIGYGIKYSLNQEGFEVLLCTDCKTAIERLDSGADNIDFAILDLTLPDGNGYDICKRIKSQADIPVIFLTACDEEVNVVMGLDMGADDYITKPFRVRELISRIKSIIRRYERSNNMGGSKLQIKDITVDFGAGKVYKEGREIILTALEYRLFLTFLNNRGQVLSRNQLLLGIWDVSGDYVNDNTLTVYIKRLREKLETDGDKLIETVRGRGYRLN
ncbi:MAG: response regulator transcription factor [Lachnospiraceae bacterium]